MGLTNTSSVTSKIVTIVKGKFTIRLADDTDNPNAVERELTKGVNAGKKVKELHYTGLEGTIDNCYIDESDFGANFITELVDDEGSRFKLQMTLDSKFFSEYAKRMPNIDITKPVFLGLGYDRENDRNFLYIKQDNDKVLMAYTKDNPNGLPQPTKKTVKGKEIWDWEEQENFLYEVALDFASKLETSDIPF
jgi:hypothetical protein